MSEKATREITQQFWVAAEPEQVWDAFTQAEHIKNWFAAESRSEPGVGGFIDLIWDRERPESAQHCVITEWEHAKHLVMSWRDAPDGEHPLPIEVNVRAENGGTLFTLTHSGFLSDASWDDEFDSHSRGWTYELKSLRHYLEQHFGSPRAIHLHRLRLHDGFSWPSLVGPGGLFQLAAGLGDAAEMTLGLPSGQQSAGTVLNALTEKDFAAVLQVLDGGVLRLTYETFNGYPEVWMWTSSWRLPLEELQARVTPWYEAAKQLVETRVAS